MSEVLLDTGKELAQTVLKGIVGGSTCSQTSGRRVSPLVVGDSGWKKHQVGGTRERSAACLSNEMCQYAYSVVGFASCLGVQRVEVAAHSSVAVLRPVVMEGLDPVGDGPMEIPQSP